MSSVFSGGKYFYSDTVVQQYLYFIWVFTLHATLYFYSTFQREILDFHRISLPDSYIYIKKNWYDAEL